MLGYLSYFSTSFIIAVLLWPFISAVLTLPILAGLYHRYHRMRFLSAAAAYLTVLYALGLVAFTLYPMPDDPQAFCAAHVGDYAPQLNPLQFVTDLQDGGLYGMLQLVMNIVLFLPLGFVLTRWLRWRWWAVLPAGFLVSLLIESSQLTGFWGLYPCAYRQFDVNDLMTNTLGALVGFGIAKLFGVLVPPTAMPDRHEVNARPGALHRTVTFVIDMLFVVLVYMPLTLGAVLGFHALAKPLPNGDFTLFGGLVTLGIDWMNAIAPSTAALAFLIFELLIPLSHHGQTLGGMFTHMTIETRERHGWLRAMFYALRTIVLGAMVVMFITGSIIGGPWLRYALYGFAIVFVFALFTRRAPWDLVPASQPSQPAQSSQPSQSVQPSPPAAENSAIDITADTTDDCIPAPPENATPPTNARAAAEATAPASQTNGHEN